MSTSEIFSNDFSKIIRSLDPNKAHGQDEIFFRMIKLLFLQSRNHWRLFLELFPKEWKKANIVPVHEKNYKKLIKHY